MPKNAFKVVMLGAQLCGKTSLIEQCVNGIYVDGMVSPGLLINVTPSKPRLLLCC